MQHSPPSVRPFDLESLVLGIEHANPLTLIGTAEAGVVPFLLASIRHGLQRPLLIITATEARAQQLIDGLVPFESEQWPAMAPVLAFEPNDVSPYHEISPVRALAQGRTAAAYRLNQEFGVAAIVLPATALLLRTLDGATLDAATAIASRGDELDRLELAEQLVAGGYERVPIVEDPGTFCVRGGVVDVWSPLYDQPARIDFFGDDIEEIRLFDPQNQSSGSHLVDLIMPPARELLLDPQRIDGIIDRVIDLADQQGIGNIELRALTQELRAGHLLPGLESLLPAVSPDVVSLLELVPEGPQRPVVVFEGPDACFKAMEQAWEQAIVQHRDALQAGRPVYDPGSLYCSPESIRELLNQHVQVHIRPVVFAEDVQGANAPPAFTLDVDSNAGMTRQLEQSRQLDQGLRPLARLIRETRRDHTLVVIAAHSEGGRQRLEQLLKHYGVATLIFDEPLETARIESLRSDRDIGALLVLGGSGEGFHIPALHMMVIDEQEVFGIKGRMSRRRARRRRREDASAAGRLIREVSELSEGDYVVHVDHGVGRYVRMMRMEAAGIEQDFLLLLYKGNEKVYVPVTGLNRVQKYASADAKTPSLDRLGAERWTKAKSKARKAAAEIATELVRLYAERQATPGHSFSAPDELYREWEATFPFQETRDQQRAIDECIADLCAPRPAWRLVCGDVGYGKTEVAIRAAVKAALDGKQVVVLVPTTVLAEQHRLTFESRCKGLPVVIDSLSRFRSSKAQRDVIARLASGQVDIVIGTHRLLSKDVIFRDLGLLIIDEEHRFGVKHKEQMQRWRSTVDCIVLSATPIPRTLQMATLGLRDLSLIATPPDNRKAVRTIVCRGSDELIKEAMQRELARGGQIFWIRNRVGELAENADYLRRLVPGLKPVVAHGQMNEVALEDAMLGFMRGDYNTLVATTIIESGLDIPNANTMFIERADTFGLAQLYQLRGRVGRASARAYCYLMVPERSRLTKEGAKRIAVLERFSELGSGVHIATHDLEIRGAGNILGERQSGHIAEVGYELYVKMLEEAVSVLRSEDLGAPVDPEIKVNVTAYLPDTWIPDPSQRLMAYKRLAAVRSVDELTSQVDQLIDRFGRMPSAAVALTNTLELRVLALELGVSKVEQGPAAIALTLHERGLLQAESLLSLLNAPGTLYRLTPQMVLVRALRSDERDDPLLVTREVLQHLLRLARGESMQVLDAQVESQSSSRASTPANRRRKGRIRRVRSD
ncbi:MAG: transcription-repair coupling factor [Myxococcales bacterium]|nr:transcription-repair coupling factor [Myxococcales bacterium]